MIDKGTLSMWDNNKIINFEQPKRIENSNYLVKKLIDVIMSFLTGVFYAIIIGLCVIAYMIFSDDNNNVSDNESSSSISNSNMATINSNNQSNDLSSKESLGLNDNISKENISPIVDNTKEKLDSIDLSDLSKDKKDIIDRMSGESKYSEDRLINGFDENDYYKEKSDPVICILYSIKKILLALSNIWYRVFKSPLR